MTIEMDNHTAAYIASNEKEIYRITRFRISNERSKFVT